MLGLCCCFALALLCCFVLALLRCPCILTQPHLTTQMLWRSLRLQLLTARSGMGVEGPPARLGAGLGQLPTPADVGLGTPLPRAPPPAPLLLLLLDVPAAKDLRRGVPAGMLLLLLGPGRPGD